MIISGRIAWFVLDDEKNLKLTMPTGEVVSDCTASIQNISDQIISNNVNTEKQQSVPLSEGQIKIETKNSEEPADKSSNNNLLASAI